ncbi:MAG: minor capsid protein [Haemophilus haemolyticus]|nr:minor capsid protein [Haemophilus haemolyticus]
MLMNLPEILKNQKAKTRKFRPVKMSKRTELWYRQQLKQFVKTMTDDIERAMQQPQGSFFMDDAKGFQAISAKALMKALEKYEKSDRTSQAENIANGFVSRGDAQNHAEVSTNLKNQTGIDLSAYLRNSPNIAERVNTLTAGNVQLIKSIRSQYLDKVQNAVMQAMVKGTLNKDLAAQIKDLGKTTEKRAMFIARDQSSKLNAALTQARHEDVGIKKYMWSTSLDERVRDSHADKEGLVFEYVNPPADTGHPGHDFNCRCVAIPVLDDVVSHGLREEVARNDDDVQIIEELIGKTDFNLANDKLVRSAAQVEQYKLSKKESLAIIGYTGSFYKQLNKALRNGDVTPKVSRYETLLNSALNKMPPFKGVTYRTIDKLSKKDLSRYLVGAIVTESFFVSSSELEKVDGFSGKVQFIINGKNGRKIADLSLYPHEKEVLFKSKSRFIVTSVTEKGLLWRKIITIELQEI